MCDEAPSQRHERTRARSFANNASTTRLDGGGGACRDVCCVCCVVSNEIMAQCTVPAHRARVTTAATGPQRSAKATYMYCDGDHEAGIQPVVVLCSLSEGPGARGLDHRKRVVTTIALQT